MLKIIKMFIDMFYDIIYTNSIFSTIWFLMIHARNWYQLTRNAFVGLSFSNKTHLNLKYIVYMTCNWGWRNTPLGIWIAASRHLLCNFLFTIQFVHNIFLSLLRKLLYRWKLVVYYYVNYSFQTKSIHQISVYLLLHK